MGAHSENISRSTSAKVHGPVSTEKPEPVATMKSTSRVYPHIDDLVQVNISLDPHTPMQKVLQVAEALAKAADTSYDFKRLDIALTDYLKASTLVVETIPRHKEFPELLSKKDNLSRQYVGLQKKIRSQDQKFREVKEIIKENNRVHATKPVSHKHGLGSAYVNGVGHGDMGDGGGAQEVTAGTTRSTITVSEQDQPGPRRQKPAVHPKPVGLQGGTLQESKISKGATDLAARFAKLRTTDSSNQQDPRIRTQPPPSPSLNTSRNTKAQPQDVTSNRSERPLGPRAMPNAPLSALITSQDKHSMPSMPRAPDAIYTPTRASETTSINLLSSNGNSSGSNFHNCRSNSQSETPIPLDTPSTNEVSDYFPTVLPITDTPTSIIRSRKEFEFPDRSTISPEELLDFNKKGMRILLIDLRERKDFDHGHIMSHSIICIEPIILREDMSADSLGECLVLSPDIEQKSFEQRHLFDLVVFYNQSSTIIPTRSVSTSDNALRLLPNIIYDHAYDHRVKRRPVLLSGGLDAWVDLVSENSLQTSKTRPLGSTQARFSFAAGRQKPLRQRSVSRPLTNEEEHKWDEALANHEKLRSQSQGDDAFIYAKTTEDVFSRKYPPITSESMTIASPVSYPTYDTIPVSSAPARPPPALPRHKSSGIVDRVAQSSLPSTHSQTPPLLPAKLVDRNGPDGECGLENFHAKICYMLSSIQALSQSPAISSFLRHFHYVEGQGPPAKEKETSKPPQLMTRFLGNLIGHLWSGQYNYVQPKSFSVSLGRAYKHMNLTDWLPELRCCRSWPFAPGIGSTNRYMFRKLDYST